MHVTRDSSGAAFAASAHRRIGQFDSIRLFMQHCSRMSAESSVRQEIGSAHKPGRRRGGRGAELRRKDFRQEKLRRLQQSIGDRSRSTSLSSHAASTRSCSEHSSSLVQVACDGRRRKLISSSLVAWRRYTQVTRCARDYRANNSRLIASLITSSSRCFNVGAALLFSHRLRTCGPTLTLDLSCMLK